jgi:hypothetical protein
MRAQQIKRSVDDAPGELQPVKATASVTADASPSVDTSRAPAVTVNAMMRPNSNSGRLSDGSR